MIRILLVSKAPNAAMADALESEADIQVVAVVSGESDVTRAIKQCHPQIILCCDCALQESIDVPVLIASSMALLSDLLPAVGRGCAIGIVAIDDILTIVTSLRACVRDQQQVYHREKHHDCVVAPLAGDAAANELIVLFGGLGALSVLEQCLSALPPTFDIPLLLSLRASPSLLTGMATWLSSSTGRQVMVAENNTAIQAGVWLVPRTCSMTVVRENKQLLLRCTGCVDELNAHLLADRLLISIAETCPGHAIGCALSGEGKDGLAGLMAIKESHCYTIAQDASEADLKSLPSSAYEMGAAVECVSRALLAEHLQAHANVVRDVRHTAR